jgi:hypothetical protein
MDLPRYIIFPYNETTGWRLLSGTGVRTYTAQYISRVFSMPVSQKVLVCKTNLLFDAKVELELKYIPTNILF